MLTAKPGEKCFNNHPFKGVGFYILEVGYNASVIGKYKNLFSLLQGALANEN